MAKNKEVTATQTEVPGTPPRKKRTPAPMPAEVQALVDEAKEKANQAKAQMKETTKEARKLGKVVSLIVELGEWSLDQLGSAIERRREAIKAQ